MLAAITRKWWPGMTADIARAVRSCSVCAMTNSSPQLPAGKLPNRPWSHIAVDFVTDLPVLKGYACVLVVVNRFSKGCWLLPFGYLLSALQVAEALFQFVFRCYRLLEYIL